MQASCSADRRRSAKVSIALPPALPQAKAVGSDSLGERVKALQPDVHLFGHSHFSWDATVQSVRCIQAPLCYPAERAARMRTIRFDDAASQGEWATPLWDQAAVWGAAGGRRSGDQPPDAPHESPALSAGTDADPAVSNTAWLPLRVFKAQRATANNAACAQAQGPIEPADTASDLTTQSPYCHDVRASARHSPAHMPLGGCEGDADLPDNEDSAAARPERGLGALDRTDAVGAGAGSAGNGREERPQDAGSMRPGVSEPERLLQPFEGRFCPRLSASWSNHYAHNKRTPEITQMVPWVLAKYSKKRQTMNLELSNAIEEP